MADNKEFLVVLRVSQDQGPGIIPVLKWDWAGNSTDGERWELLACGLYVDLGEAVRNIASERVIDAAEYAAAEVEKKEAPPSMPQAVTMDDFPESSGDKVVPTAQYEGPADYLERTGKRFRMTKDQKDRGLSRDDAFTEFVSGLDG